MTRKQPDKREIGTIRKFVFYCILILLLYLFFELLCFATHSIVKKDFFSWSSFQNERMQIISATDRKKAQNKKPEKGDNVKPIDGNRKKNPVTSGPLVEVIQPYIGFVYSARRDDWSEYGFLDRRILDNKFAPFTQKTADNFIVAIFGGSFAYGVSVSSSKGYLESELKQIPRLADKKIIIHTLSMGGWKQPQQLMALAYFLSLDAHFDMVINIDGFNEVALPPSENIPKNVFPFYPRSWLNRVLKVPDEELQYMIGTIALYKKKQHDLAKKFARSPLRYSVFMNIVWEYLNRQLSLKKQETETEFSEYKLTGSNRFRYMALGPYYDNSNEKKIYEDLSRMWQRSSLQMSLLCQGNGIDYFHFLQPNQYVTGSKPMSPEEEKIAIFDSHPYKIGIVKGYPSLTRLGKYLKQQGVNFHDLTMIFADNDDVLYYDTCCHLNEKGYDLVIDRILEIIKTNFEKKAS